MADWTQRGSVITAPDAAANLDFGYRVATNADASAFATTSRYWNTSLDSTAGVYVFVWDGSSWAQRGSVVALPAYSNPSVHSNDYASGDSIAINEDATILVIGSAQYGTGLDQLGGVDVFDWDGSAWTQRGSVLTASDGVDGDGFGKGVAISGDGSILFVGANGWEGANSNQGGVYVFDWSGSAWTQRGSVITAGDAAASDQFGFSVGCSQDGAWLIVGATAWEGTTTNQGGAYVLSWDGSSWSQVGSVIVASDPLATDHYAETVSINGDGTRVAIGADQWEGAITNMGRTYVFGWSGSAWSALTHITAPDAASNDLFGPAALDSTGSVAIVGASLWEGANSNQGGVYVFDYTPPPAGSGAFTIRPTVAGAGEFTNTTGASGSGSITIYPAGAGAGTFPTNYGSGGQYIRSG